MRLRTTGDLIYTVREIPSVTVIRTWLLVQCLCNKVKRDGTGAVLPTWKMTEQGMYLQSYAYWEPLLENYLYLDDNEPKADIMHYYWLNEPRTAGHIILKEDLRICLRELNKHTIIHRPIRPSWEKTRCLEGIPLTWINSPTVDGGLY